MTVVLVVGASPKGPTSAMRPIASVTSEDRPKLLDDAAVIATTGSDMRFRIGSKRTSSSVSPLCERASTASSECNAPRSPCTASAGCSVRARTPSEASVAAIFCPMSPALPIPVTTTPPAASSSSTASQNEPSSRSASFATASASARSTSFACRSCSSGVKGTSAGAVLILDGFF